MKKEHGGWTGSAQAWIDAQGEFGDGSRRDILDPALEPILGNVAGLTILDVGCGEGRYARLLATKGATVTGLDPVDDFINLARSRHPQGKYVVGTAEQMPFTERSFDIVLSYLSIVDIPDHRRAIGEMTRVLSSTGRIVLVTISNMASTSDTWVRDTAGRKLYRTVDRYMDEFSLDLKWSGIHIQNYHRPLSAIFSPFFEAGLLLDGFYEPLPAKGSPDYVDEYRVPTFQIMTFRFAG